MAPRLFPARGFPAPVRDTAPKSLLAEHEAKTLVFTQSALNFFDFSGRFDSVIEARLTGLRAFRAYWLVYACMSFRATKLAEAPLWITEEGEDGEEWIEGDHPLSELLEQPNPDMDLTELLETVSLYLDATARCLLVKNVDRGKRTASLYPFAGDEFTVEPANGRLHGRFRANVLNASGTGTTQREYGPDEVIFLRYPHDVAPLDAALEHVNIGHEMRRAVSSRIRRAIRPGAIFTTDQTLSETDHTLVKTEIGTSYAGATNSGRSMFLTGGVKGQILESGLRDLDLGPMQGDVEVAICGVFKVHPLVVGAKVGLAASSGFADTMRPAQDAFYDQVTHPQWRRIETKLTAGLLRPIDPNPLRFIRFDTTKVRALQLDLTKRTAEAGAAQRFWTRNEGRIHTGQQPFEDEDPRGDELISEGGGIDLSQFGIGGGGRRTASTDREDPDDGDEEDTDDEDAKARTGARARTKARRDNNRITGRDVARAIHVALIDSHASTVELMAARALEADRTAILALLPSEAGKAASQRPVTDAEVRAARKKIEEYLDGPALEQWKTLSEPVVMLIARGAVERAAGATSISFDLLQPGLLEYVKRETAFLVQSVTDTTRDVIKRELGNALEAGETHDQMRKRIQDSAGFTTERSQLIARTEATRATNSAARESMQTYAAETGLTTTKTWITAGDAKVRDEHRAIDGETVPVDQPFSNGRMNPDEPNCRCSLTFAVSAPKGAQQLPIPKRHGTNGRLPHLTEIR